MALAADSARVTFALRNLNSDAKTILTFDTRETAGQNGPISYLNRLPRAIYTYRREFRHEVAIPMNWIFYILVFARATDWSGGTIYLKTMCFLAYQFDGK